MNTVCTYTMYVCPKRQTDPMSVPSFSYTASELRAMKKDRAAERLRKALQSICLTAKDYVLKQAEDTTSASFQVRPAYAKAEWGRIYQKHYNRGNPPPAVIPHCHLTVYTIGGATSAQMDIECTEEFVGMCLTELEKLFPECKIEGISCDETYTITIDWSEPVSAPAPAPASAAVPPTVETVESLLAKLEALQAENAALKRPPIKQPDVFEMLELFVSLAPASASASPHGAD